MIAHAAPRQFRPPLARGLLGLLALPLGALTPTNAAAQSGTWRYEPVENGALALSCRDRGDRACAIAFCGGDGRLGLGLTGWSPGGDRDRREAFVAIDGSGRPGTLTRGDTRLDGETLWQLEVDGSRVETQLERLRRGSELRIEAGRGGEPFVFGLRGSSNAIGQLQARCERIAFGEVPEDGTSTGSGDVTAEQIIGGIAVGVIEELLRERAERDRMRERERFNDDDDRFDDAPRAEVDRFRDRVIGDGRANRADRPWPRIEVNTRRAVSVQASFGRRERTLVVPLNTRVGRLWVEIREPRRLSVSRITAVYRNGDRRRLDLDRWRESRRGRVRLPDGDLMQLEIRGNVTRGDDRVDVLVTAAPQGVTPERYERPARREVDWIALGRRTVGGGTDRDRLDLSRSEGRYDALGLSVAGSPVAVDNVVVSFGNGTSQRIDVRDTVRDGERIILNLPGRRPRAIERLVITYAGTGRGQRPVVDFWGRRVR